jgi:hypothetical protein
MMLPGVMLWIRCSARYILGKHGRSGDDESGKRYYRCLHFRPHLFEGQTPTPFRNCAASRDGDAEVL